MLEYEIIVDHSETANKCTILPLSYRADFHIDRRRLSHTLSADILLHPNGLPLPQFIMVQPRVQRLAAIDCIWRRLDPILERLEHPHPHLVRIPEQFVTAYPRRSRKDFDPDGGLATIEALFIAAAFVGTWDLSLLREYFFAEKFLELNAAAFRHFGIGQELEAPVFQPLYPLNSRKRRIGRGRIPW